MSDQEFLLRLASPAELREMVQTLTRERDEARAKADEVANDAVRLFRGDCRGDHSRMSFQEFVAAGGNGCPLCDREASDRAREALEKAHEGLGELARGMEKGPDGIAWAKEYARHVQEEIRVAIAEVKARASLIRCPFCGVLIEGDPGDVEVSADYCRHG